ncbi:hypothetical protein LMTR13_08040 [Bradyrhizobium icense]|uniref:Uncharacterized protein n=1 Tax=Bradyrhizobium icense TaxID=1274631 RepID=A0A1B1UBI5_9BRAD|nr:hypothetical protein LMTR13_08040 [Bradyrhizobium icense]
MRSDLVIPGAELDDVVVSYGLGMASPFEDLRQVATQLAGVLLLATAGSRAAAWGHPMLRLAEDMHQGAMERIRSATVPRGAAHHHYHLVKAGSLIGDALRSCKAARVLAADVDPALSSLRDGWEQLRLTAAALPGFEVIAFDRACCAEHVRMA